MGLTKMAESCPGTTYAKLSWLQACHIRDETYSAELADLVNAQYRQPFAQHWGDGTASSSDGQRFQAGGHAEARGHVNPKYRSEPGVQFYTHVSDQKRSAGSEPRFTVRLRGVKPAICRNRRAVPRTPG